MARKLFHSVDRMGISKKNLKTYKDGSATIQERLGTEGMRVIGKAFDQGVVK